MVFTCRAVGKMTILPSGHLRVTFTMEYKLFDQWFGLASGTRVFDPSGFGGTPSAPVATINATVGQEVNLSSSFVDPDLVNLNRRKVWYFGDGSAFEAGTGVAPNVPTPHTYSHPGTYPALLVYYYFDSNSEEWRIAASLPVRVNVT